MKLLKQIAKRSRAHAEGMFKSVKPNNVKEGSFVTSRNGPNAAQRQTVPVQKTPESTQNSKERSIMQQMKHIILKPFFLVQNQAQSFNPRQEAGPSVMLSLRRTLKYSAIVTFALLTVLTAVSPPAWSKPSPEDFGYASMRVEGHRAHFERPLLIILAEYSDRSFRPAHTSEFYNNFIFGPGFPNIRDYFSEVSSGTFTWAKAWSDVIGPFEIPDDPSTDWDESRRSCWWDDKDDMHPSCAGRPGLDKREYLFPQAAIKTADKKSSFPFSSFDDDGNGQLTNSEIGIAIVEAAPATGNNGGSSRWIGERRDGTDSYSVGDGTTIEALQVVGFAEGVGFDTIAHELAHLLGTEDIYGATSRSWQLSIMSSTIDRSSEDTKETYHLDPWHKIQLGWVKPRIRSTEKLIDSTECMQLPAQDDARPLVLYDPSRGTNEYYLLENRDPKSGRLKYDGDIPGSSGGIAVWYVQTDPDGSLKYLDARIHGGANNKLESRVDGDDIRNSGFITPGPDGILQSTASGDDAIDTDALNYTIAPGVSGDPTAFSSRGKYQPKNQLWNKSDGDMKLKWFGEGTSYIGPTLQVLGKVDHRPYERWVHLNSNRMNIDSDVSASMGFPGQEVTMSGCFGAQGSKKVRLRTGRRGDRHPIELDVTFWNYTTIGVTLPTDLEPRDDYYLSIRDTSSKVNSNSHHLKIREEPIEWRGTYEGQLDGRNARLTIEDDSIDLLHRIILEDLDRDTTYQGSIDTVDTHIQKDLTLRSSDGTEMTIERLFIHTEDENHISGYTTWKGKHHGLAFSKEGDGTTGTEDVRLDRSDPERWTLQWIGVYDGRLNGQEAELTVSNSERQPFGDGYQYKFDIQLETADNSYEGHGFASNVGDNSSHVILIREPLSSDDGSTRDLAKLYLHTWDTHYVTGVLEEQDERYGAHFKWEVYPWFEEMLDPPKVELCPEPCQRLRESLSESDVFPLTPVDAEGPQNPKMKQSAYRIIDDQRSFIEHLNEFLAAASIQKAKPIIGDLTQSFATLQRDVTSFEKCCHNQAPQLIETLSADINALERHVSQLESEVVGDPNEGKSLVINVDEMATLPVELPEAPSGLSQFTLVFAVDSGIAALNAEPSAELQSGQFNWEVSEDGSRVRVSFQDTAQAINPGHTQPVNLLNLKLFGLNPGQTTLNLTEASISDEQGNQLSLPFEPLTVEVRSENSAGPISVAPLSVSQIHVRQQTPNAYTFAVQGQGVKATKVNVFSLAGTHVVNSNWQTGRHLRWTLQNNRGQRVANGVYLYVVSVRGNNGEVIRSEVKKLVILR